MNTKRVVRCKYCGSIISVTDEDKKAMTASKNAVTASLSDKVSPHAESEEVLRRALEISPEDRTFMDLIDELIDCADPFNGVASSTLTASKKGLVSWRVNPELIGLLKEELDVKLAKSAVKDRILDFDLSAERINEKIIFTLDIDYEISRVEFEEENNLAEDVATDILVDIIDGEEFSKCGTLRVLEAGPSGDVEHGERITIVFKFSDKEEF